MVKEVEDKLNSILPEQKFQDILKQFNQIDKKINNYKIIQYSKIMKRYKQLTNIIELYQQLQYLYECQLDVNSQDLTYQDKQMYIDMYQAQITPLQEDLLSYLQVKDPLDDTDEIIVQIRAGVGGDQGGVFARQIFNMYVQYAIKNNWNLTVTDSNQTAATGSTQAIKKVIFNLKGKDVYKKMKYESGIHRVIRTPVTEASDRTHTSTCTVAILPIVQDPQFQLNMDDVRIQDIKGTGAGGQHINTTCSTIRVTHIPTGIMVRCQDQRSKRQNKITALKQLTSRLYNIKLQQQQKQISQKRKQLVGRGDCSSRIRTYNFKKRFFEDHRINYKTTKIEQIMSGELDEVVSILQKQYARES